VSYTIRFAHEVDEHIRWLTAGQHARALEAVGRQLVHEPDVETRNRKRMQQGKPGFVAPWELRIGELRGVL